MFGPCLGPYLCQYCQMMLERGRKVQVPTKAQQSFACESLIWNVSGVLLHYDAVEMTAVGFEPTPLRTAALSQRLRPLGQTVLNIENSRKGKYDARGYNWSSACAEKPRTRATRALGDFISKTMFPEHVQAPPRGFREVAASPEGTPAAATLRSPGEGEGAVWWLHTKCCSAARRSKSKIIYIATCLQHLRRQTFVSCHLRNNSQSFCSSERLVRFR